jgi:pimeloyl-ACP methyl ester carboxylesterase
MPVHPDLLEAARKDDPLAYDLVTSWGHGPAGHLGKTPVPGLSLIGGGRALLSSAPKGALGNDLEACNVYQNGMNAARNIHCPTLCIIGSDDKMTPPRNGMELASTIPEAKTEIIQNCGHMMLLEDSNASLKALKGHLNSFES